MAETTDTTITTQKKVRNSNIELFRIFLMLMIVAHHYVVNSGITLLYDYNHISFNQVFLWLWGWGGKVGINCFLLITGFFMCQQQITLKKFLKLYLEVKFYKILIFAIFCLSGYEAFTSIGLFKAVFNIAYGMGNGFVATFVGLFLLIPFINKMLSAITRREHLALVAVLTGLYTVFGTFFGNNIHENLGWFVTVYVIGAFLRLYPHQCFADRRMMATVSASCLLLSWASIVIIGYFFPRGSGAAPIYYFVNDSHRILAIVCAVSFFLLFNSLKVKQSSIITPSPRARLASC